ncbi:hypothetical protein PSEUBRA_003077 [Kalmanozyma brasiliensis GHG001]|uniref:RGS domain-containing protein n=1 Tax=Kalmanozyma brasiliensis (strain GHG001) TaxID=1365824 RepID=V5EBY1_KALBG|nr:uncharacterized protein PSEUBRA_003077 [Kalmanozyma brasiliensis GHG001]EST07946.1 hypothetical protein PSEUBRA_003077 [Kalmanozyma brasiliensis GHG001]
MSSASPTPARGAVAATDAAPSAQFPSATEHNVYADNRDEDIFGWIQPDEWDTVAGVNKNNFMRGDCLECAADQEKTAAPASSTLQSCGGPSCGYGAQCCEYSRRATHAVGSSQRTPALLLQRSNTKAGGNTTIADLAKKEQKSSLGVSLIDIIHGRSCRPISLLDLRTFLHFQRLPHKRLPAYYPASDMQSSAIDDLDLNFDLPSSSTSSPPSPRYMKEKEQTAERLHYDEVDALDFLVAYERYVTKFRDQARADRLKSPDPATCKAAVRAYVRRACKGRASSDLTAMDVLLQGSETTDDLSDIPEEMSREVLARLKPSDLGLKPETQPLRVDFDRMVHRYLCSRRACILPSSRKGRKKRYSSSSSDTVADAPDSPVRQLGSSKNDKMPRLRWMVDMGLISEGDLQLALAECDFSTHPEVLAPVAEAVYAYMSQHVVPFFFISVTSNLGNKTKRGRLMVGIVLSTIALILSILLIIEPSPFAPRANGNGDISRWWRLLTAPIWAAGLGYVLAYFTGLCVWLTLRGNREPDAEEEREREEIRSRISGEDVIGFDLAELQAAADQRDVSAEQDTNRWMAPEIANILTGITGLKKDKHRKNRSSSDLPAARSGGDLRNLEEGRHRSKSEVTESGFTNKDSFELGDTSNAVHLQPYFEKESLTAPAAVILHTPRRPAVAESVGRPSATFSDAHTSHPVRPSMDRAPNSSDGSVDRPLAPGAAVIKQKRVPLLNFSIGIMTKNGAEAADESVETPAFTRDALLFDPELATRAAPGSPDASVSPQPGMARRKSLSHTLLPFKSSTKAVESDAEKEEFALPTIPEPEPAALDPRDIAPWSAPAPAPLTDRPLLFSLPTDRKSRLSAATSTTAVAPTPVPVPRGPKRAYDSKMPLHRRVWSAVQRGTGFAVGTERVLDARVRRAQQMKALRITALDALATVVVVVIVMVIP